MKKHKTDKERNRVRVRKRGQYQRVLICEQRLHEEMIKRRDLINSLPVPQ